VLPWTTRPPRHRLRNRPGWGTRSCSINRP
jgi:hypothetical protein